MTRGLESSAAGAPPVSSARDDDRLGARLFADRRFGEAAAAFRRVLALEPQSAIARANLGAALTALGQYDDAIAHLKMAVAQDPRLAAAHASLGWALREQRRTQEAIEALTTAVGLNADNADAWSNLGLARADANDAPGSEAAYRRAVQLRAEFPEALCGLGVAVKAQGRLAESAEAFRRAIRADASYAPAFNNLGNTLAAMDRKTPALMAYRAALRRRPDYADAQSNLGALLRRLGRAEEALTALRRAVEMDPRSATAAFNLANALAAEAADDTEAAYEQVLSLRPQWPSAHLNYAFWLLREGRYARGWAEYEWRWAMPAAKALAQRLPQPRWTGQPVDGKVVLITAEQGLGDTLQCARYFPLLAQRGATVLVEAQEALRDLLLTVPGVARVVSAGDWIERIDLQCPTFSLPLAFGTTLETIPAEVPYLHPPADRIARWGAQLPAGFRVGVVWQGNAASSVDRGRSFPLAALEPLAAVAGVTLISLQKPQGANPLAQGEAPFQVHRLGPAFDDGSMLDTAAIVANLDLVIACDTAVAHLAGALGRPVWIALKHRAEWRWLRQRSDSPWYASARLYRQSTEGQWAFVFKSMAEDLA